MEPVHLVSPYGPVQLRPGVSPQEAAERRTLIKATQAINDAQALGGKNELVFILDNVTHRAIMRVIDKETKEVVMQLPPDYVVHLAQTVG